MKLIFMMEYVIIILFYSEIIEFQVGFMCSRIRFETEF